MSMGYRATLTRRHAIAMWLVVATVPLSVLAGGSPSFVISVPESSAQVIPLSPGATKEFSIAIENQGTGEGIADLALVVTGDESVRAEYDFVPTDPERCRVSADGGYASFALVGFHIGPLQAGQRLICNYRLSRASSSRSDFSLTYCGPSTAPIFFSFCAQHAAARGGTWVAGTLPDLALRATPTAPIPAGATEATLRISVSNSSSQDALAKGVETECAEFGGGFFGPSPFDIDNDFPGACPSAPVVEGCGNFTAQNFSNKAYAVGPIPAGTEASCLLHLRFLHPLTAPVSLGFELQTVSVPYVNGGVGMDPDRTNEISTLSVGPQAESVPAAHWTALAALALFLSVAASRNARYATVASSWALARVRGLESRPACVKVAR